MGEYQMGNGKLIEMHGDHCVSMLGLHLVWCTKYRKPVLTGEVELTVRNMIGQAAKDNGWRCITVEIMPDHVHVFLQIQHTDAPVHVLRMLKSITAVAVFTSFPKLKGQKFWGSGLWSRGAYYGSGGQVSQETITAYIQNQKKKETAGINMAVSTE